MRRELTTSQTAGPYFSLAMLQNTVNILTGPDTAGERIRIEGRVTDGDGSPVADALVEIWQANGSGRYNHPADTRPLPLERSFTGFGRAGTDDDGCYWFETIKPGAVPFDREREQAPHISVAVFARGVLNHFFTRIYLEGEPANDSDPVLNLVPASRRSTLIATRAGSGDTPLYLFDIVLQGDVETVFFNI